MIRRYSKVSINFCGRVMGVQPQASFGGKGKPQYFWHKSSEAQPLVPTTQSCFNVTF
jgi:hypothetical protein